MVRPPPADLDKVTHSRSTATRLDEMLSALSADIVVGRRGSTHRENLRLVASAGGVFVLDPDPIDIDADDTTGRVADRTREQLAEHLSWVPFVDWMVVVDEWTDQGAVPLDMVSATLLQGHALPRDVIASISGLLVRGSLAPEWEHGLPGTTDLRTPAPETAPTA